MQLFSYLRVRSEVFYRLLNRLMEGEDDTEQTENKKTTIKETLFCYYFHHYRNGREAAVKAGYSPRLSESIAARLLQREEIRRLCRQFDREYHKQQLYNDVISGLKRLAFGSVRDGVKLMFDGEISDWENLDLFSVREIKRQKNGTMEIRFADRFQALEKLLELEEMESEQGGTAALYRALELGAQSLGKHLKEDGD